MLRWIKRIVLALLAVMVVAVVALVIALHTDWGRNIVRRRIEAAMLLRFPGGTRIGSLEGSVFGELTLRDVEIDGRDHVPELTIGTATMRLDLWPLLDHTARFQELALEDVMMIRKPSPAGDPSTWTIEIRDLAVHRARVTQNKIEVDDIDATGAVQLAPGGDFAAVIDARARYGGEPITATMIVQRDGGVVSLPLALIEGAGARASALCVRAVPEVSLEGTLVVALPVAAARRLTGLEIGYDVALALDAKRETIDARGTIGRYPFHALLHPDLVATTSRGLIVGDIAEVGELTKGVITGSATIVAALHATVDGVRGIISVGGPAAVALALDATWTGGWVRAGGGNRDGRATASIDFTRKDHIITIDRGKLVAHATVIRDVTGAFDARFEAKGLVWPPAAIDLHASGRVDGTQATWGKLAAGSIAMRVVDLHHVPGVTTADAHVEIGRASRDGRALGSGRVDLHGTRGRDEIVTIELGDHDVSASDGSIWKGTGGWLELDHDRTTLAKLHTSSGNGQITAGGSYTKSTGDLTATIDAKEIKIAGGKLEVNGTLSRSAGRWSGSGTTSAHGIVVDADRPPLDGHADLKIVGRRVTLNGAATSTIGSATLAMDLEGPVDILDRDAWRALDRGAIRELVVTLEHLDTGRGIIAGDLTLSAKDVHGKLQLRGARVRTLEIDGDVTLAPGHGDELAITGTARAGGVGGATGEVHIAMPVRIFDPAAWQTLGTAALRDGNVRLDEVAVDPAMLAKLGVTYRDAPLPYSGRISGTATIAPGGTGATIAADVRELHGGALVKPIDVHLKGGIDARDANVAITAQLKDTILVELIGRATLSVDQLLAGKGPNAPLAATIAIPAVSGREILSIFDRSNIVDGTLTALVEVTGTIATPTGHGTLTIRDVTVPASIPGRAPTTLNDLVVDAKWDGAACDVVATGHEATGGLLHATGNIHPADLTTAAISLDATKFDLAPVAAFAPKPWVTVVGVIDASVSLRGLDLGKGDARGEVHLREGRVPIATKVGMLRHVTADITIADHRVNGTATGKLGDGDVTAKGTVTLDGAAPTAAEGSMTLRKVSPIGSLEPVIDADVTAKLVREPAQWTGQVAVRNGHVVIPASRAEPLFDAGPPTDMTFVDAAPKPNVPFADRPPPTDPAIVLEVDLGSTLVEADEVIATVSGQVKVSYAKGAIGADGEIDTERGVAEVFGRRYQVDHGSMRFDGTIDPLLGIRMVHDFPDVTLTADITGRASNPDLVLSSDPAKYTQGQLLGFFLGGAPGGDPGSEAREAATNVSTSVVSGRINKQLNKVLPVKIDVINYEAATSASSAAIRAGKWLSEKLFVAYRQHLSARPDENTGEGDAEYYLRQNVLIQGTAGDRGYDGIDLLWRKRW